jgi:hypothetical protein
VFFFSFAYKCARAAVYSKPLGRSITVYVSPEHEIIVLRHSGTNIIEDARKVISH